MAEVLGIPRWHKWFGRDFDETLANLDCVLERLKQAGLKLKPSKCPTLASASHCEGGQVVHRVRSILPQVYSKLFRHWPILPKSLRSSSGINTVKGLFRSSRRSWSLLQYFHIQWGIRVTLFVTLMLMILPWGCPFTNTTRGGEGVCICQQDLVYRATKLLYYQKGIASGCALCGTFQTVFVWQTLCYRNWSLFLEKALEF